MTDFTKIRRIPSRISGRSFSNGILLRGGTRQVVAIRKRDKTIDIETTAIKVKNTNKTFSAFINMFTTAFCGLIKSIAVFKKNPRVSLIRLFKYHGAEHKVIHCYEDGLELTVENAKKCPTYHNRCGSSLVANILIIEGIICLLVPSKIRNMLGGFVEVIIFLAALFLGFKITRYSNDHNNKVTRLISLPGKILQKVTALEPDEEILECGIAAAKKLVQSEYQ